MVSFQKALWDIDVGTKIDKDEGDVAVVGKRLSLYIFGSVRISVYLYTVLYTCTLYCIPVHCKVHLYTVLYTYTLSGYQYTLDPNC